MSGRLIPEIRKASRVGGFFPFTHVQKRLDHNGQAFLLLFFSSIIMVVMVTKESAAMPT